MACWKEDFIVKNEFSRPGIKLLGVKGIVMHWTATPGATRPERTDFFDGKDGGGGRYASAHFFVDRDSATLIIPLDEVAYHANEHACKWTT
jgi:N-acetylmuramoyl-L-alanine amidase